jgi:hypothetical protein
MLAAVFNAALRCAAGRESVLIAPAIRAHQQRRSTGASVRLLAI